MKTAKLLFENTANWQYATGITVSDPRLWYQAPNGETYVIVSDLELAEAREQATVDHVCSFDDVKAANPGQPLDVISMVRFLMVKGGVPERIEVPANFSTGHFVQLQNAGIPLGGVFENLFFPARAVKTAEQIANLKAAQKLNEKCFKRAIAVLKQSKIESDGTLSWRKKPLTSELVQAEMRIVAVKNGVLDFNSLSPGPIVTCAEQASTPHVRGHGVLRARELIIIDSFPRHPNRYWGDLTRTYIKGQPTDAQRKVYEAVLKAQELALSMLKPGTDGQLIHTAVVDSFKRSGFETGNKNGTPFGYFHGTGHGVGMELHEPGPTMLGSRSCELKAGYVTSVEPGLYYPPGTHPQFMGGCRIEDVVAITRSGHKNLTTLSKTDWIIP